MVLRCCNRPDAGQSRAVLCAALSRLQVTAKYGSGSWTGVEVTDVVRIGSLAATTTFVSITNQQTIVSETADAIWGTAYQRIAAPGRNGLLPLFDAFVAQVLGARSLAPEYPAFVWAIVLAMRTLCLCANHRPAWRLFVARAAIGNRSPSAQSIHRLDVCRRTCRTSSRRSCARCSSTRSGSVFGVRSLWLTLACHIFAGTGQGRPHLVG
jgi:hypothetical protein